MEPYALLALSGLAPQVVTETAWSLARQHAPPLVPTRVEVVSTGVGRAYGRAQLLGERSRDPVTGAEVAHAADRWGPFCDATFGRRVPLRFHVPEADGQPLADVTGVEADRRFADICYRLVARLTAPGEPPLVGSLAGGRKTLSAHLMTAFAVYARPQDRLVHVLVHPASAERDPTFFHPHAGSEARVHRVDVPFPRLRSLLTEGPAGAALQAGAGLRDLLETIQPHLDAERTPGDLVVWVRDGHVSITAGLGRDRLAEAQLTPAEGATFMAVAEAVLAGGGTTRLGSLVGSPVGEARRAAVMEACGRSRTLSPWTSPGDVSKAVSRVNTALATAPLVSRFLCIESDVKADATDYRWAEPLPAPLSVTVPPDVRSWPFRHLQVSAPPVG